MDSVLASHPADPGSILGVPKIFSDFEFSNKSRVSNFLKRFIDSSALVLASGKLALQKNVNQRIKE